MTVTIVQRRIAEVVTTVVAVMTAVGEIEVLQEEMTVVTQKRRSHT